MSKTALRKFVSSLKGSKDKELVIRIHSSGFKKNLNKSLALLEDMERMIRIQKLEMAVKKMRIHRSLA